MCRIALLLLTFCAPAKANTALLALNVSLSLTDAQTTYDFHPPGYFVSEKDPLTRPFVSTLSKREDIALAIGGDVLLADIGLRMRRSNRWYRHVWWLPQVAVAAGNAWGVTNNLEVRRSLH